MLTPHLKTTSAASAKKKFARLSSSDEDAFFNNSERKKNVTERNSLVGNLAVWQGPAIYTLPKSADGLRRMRLIWRISGLMLAVIMYVSHRRSHPVERTFVVAQYARSGVGG